MHNYKNHIYALIIKLFIILTKIYIICELVPSYYFYFNIKYNPLKTTVKNFIISRLIYINKVVDN